MTQKKKVALGRAFDYFDAVVKSDVSRVDGVKRDADRTRRIMRSYARHQGAPVPVSTIASDIRVNDVDTVDDKTVYSYISALKKIFVIEDMEALNALANKIDTSKMKEPSFKMVLTAVGKYAYRQGDGIFIVPVGCLKD